MRTFILIGLILTTILLVTIIPLFSQEESEAQKTVIANFTKQYNDKKYETIYDSFSTEMQSALPIENTKQFFGGLQLQAGNIEKYTVAKHIDENYVEYKTTFERVVLSVKISIDNNHLINGLLIEPYKEETKRKDIINQLSSGSLSAAQSEIIFNRAKVFPNKTQLSIAVIEDGQINFQGVLIDDNKMISVHNQENIFEIGSITKVFTSTLLANLILEGKIKATDNINDYLDFSLNNNTALTFIDLANHHSGLPSMPSNLDLSAGDQTNPYKDYDKQQLESFLKNDINIHTENQGTYQYSNLGTAILGYTLCEIAGKDYEEFLSDKIFDKYNMANSVAQYEYNKGDIVKGLNEYGEEVSKWDLAAMAPAGSILSSTKDLSKFVLAQFDETNKDLQLTREKTIDGPNQMGLGMAWHLIKTDQNNTLHWHNGGTGGYSSSMALDIQHNQAIIILSNVSAFSPDMGNIDKLCFELIDSIQTVKK
jgi:CubicO group peptidase (beta-lactamase class C family)